MSGGACAPSPRLDESKMIPYSRQCRAQLCSGVPSMYEFCQVWRVPFKDDLFSRGLNLG